MLNRILLLASFLPLALSQNATVPSPPLQPVPPMTDLPWLRICDGDISPYNAYLLKGDCTGGYMFQTPFQPTSGDVCVCGNGIWILKSGYCNQGQTYILFAEGNDCFSIKSDVKWVRYLGHPETAKLDSEYIASEFFDYVEKLRKTGPSRLIASKSIWTIAIGGDPQNVYLPQEQQCFRSDWRPIGEGNTTGVPLARVGRSADPPPDSFPQPHMGQILSYCPYYAKEGTTEWIQGGGMLVLQQGMPSYRIYFNGTQDVHNNCRTRCSNTPPPPYNSTTNTSSGGAMDDANMIELYPTSAEDSLGKQMSSLEMDDGTPTNLTQNCAWDAETSREMDLQTLRMIRVQTAFSLRQIRTPVAYVKEFEYLQKARAILADKCPVLKASLLKSFVRMFRYILLESIENHPYREVGTNESHYRILEALSNCSNQTGSPERNITFVYNITTCPKQLLMTQYLPDKETAPRNCSTRIPKNLKFDSCQYDLVTEVTYKVVLFSHYFCSRFFANVAQDESEFYTTMEKLFNPDILMRYYNPGNSFKGLKFVFQMFDLNEFMDSLDKCLGCARDISQYRAWLKRPQNLKMCPMTSSDGGTAGGYNFDIDGYTGIQRNPLFLPYKTFSLRTKTYQCYSTWRDGLYTRPRQQVPSNCGLGIHVLGETATFN